MADIVNLKLVKKVEEKENIYEELQIQKIAEEATYQQPAKQVAVKKASDRSNSEYSLTSLLKKLKNCISCTILLLCFTIAVVALVISFLNFKRLENQVEVAPTQPAVASTDGQSASTTTSATTGNTDGPITTAPGSISGTMQDTFKRPQKMVITPGNIMTLASFIQSSANITRQSIHFPAGGTNAELLIQVPISKPKELLQNATIIITVFVCPPSPLTRDRDAVVGISDGNTVNRFTMFDQDNYGHLPSCGIDQADLMSPGTDLGNRVTSTTPVPYKYTLLFQPMYNYGSCYTAQEGGYLNVGEFDNSVNISNGVNLEVYRHTGNDGGNGFAEQYTYYGFTVETIS